MASEIKITNIKANDGTASLTIANSNGNVTNAGTFTSAGAITASGGIANAGTISAGTIGDNVVHQSAKYFLNLEAPDSQYGAIDTEMINNSGTTRPYFATGVGDTTNIVAVNNHDYKLVKAGIYIINFSVNFYESSNQTERNVGCQIRHNASSPTSTEGTDVLGQGKCMVASVNSSSDYSSATAHVVYNFTANHLINFRVFETDSGYLDSAWASICLIRPT